MNMKWVIKRDNKQVKFDSSKIKHAIEMAAEANHYDLTLSQLNQATNEVVRKIDDVKIESITVEEIQDLVVETLHKQGYSKLVRKYQEYREERNKVRESKTDLMKKIIAIGVETDRDNANVGNNFSAKLLRIASEANKWHIINSVLPARLAQLHNNGDVYIHDLDSYNLTINCLHLPTHKLLTNGFNTGYGTINPPNSIGVAAELVCIMLQASQNDMFGGQSHPNFDNDLAPYVGLTREKIRKQLIEEGLDHAKIDEILEQRVKQAVRQAMQAIVFNLNTMHSRAGSQVPFSSLNIGIPFSKDAAMVCEEFLNEYRKGLGQGEQPIFPNIIFRVKEGVNREPNDPYHYLFELACSVAGERMNPTFMNIDADFNKKYYDEGILPATMGCRTYILTDVNGKPCVEGRGNNAPSTINLPRLGILANHNIDKFFELLDQRIDDTVDLLMHRYEVLKKLKVKDLPFVAGQGLMLGSENLSPNDPIDPIMAHGTWGIGFIGIAETLIALIGKHHGENEEARKLGLRIVTHIRKRCDDLKKERKMNFSCYATPAEGLSGKFVKQDRKFYGIIKGVTDRDYYTNSYHVPVYYPISIADKIKIEAPYHNLCNGGHISYIEFDSYPSAKNVKDIITWAYKNININYMGINFHIRYCLDCAQKSRENKIIDRKKAIDALAK